MNEHFFFFWGGREIRNQSTRKIKNEQPAGRSLADPATKPHSTGERERRTWHRPPLPLKKGLGHQTPTPPVVPEGKERTLLLRCRPKGNSSATTMPVERDSSWLWGGREPSPWPTVEGNPGIPLTTFLPLHKPRRPSGSDQIVLPILDTSLPSSASLSPGQRHPQWHYEGMLNRPFSVDSPWWCPRRVGLRGTVATRLPPLPDVCCPRRQEWQCQGP